MDNNAIPKVKTVHIMLLGMDDRQYAMFRMAFKMHGTTNYELVTEDQGVTPEMVLVDVDTNPEAWGLAKQRYSMAKVIYFSSTPPQITAPYLPKPIKFDTLFASLKNLQQGNGVWVARPTIPTGFQSAPATSADNKNQVASISIEHFNIEDGLLGTVKKASQQEQDIAVLQAGKPVLLIFPSIQKVLLAADSATLKSLCEQKFVDLQTRPVSEENLKAKAKLSISACLWQLALWTANGKLPKEIGLNNMLQLRSWPNLTRLAPVAESMRLSAFLTKTPASPVMLHKLMSVDERDLAEYLTATYVSGYLDIVGAGAPVSQPAPSASATIARPTSAASAAPKAVNNNEEEAPKQRGLLQRLMNKIIGR